MTNTVDAWLLLRLLLQPSHRFKLGLLPTPILKKIQPTLLLFSLMSIILPMLLLCCLLQPSHRFKLGLLPTPIHR
jgi:hypothetical protein